MKWTVVEIEQFDPVDPGAQLFHESMEEPIAYYNDRQQAWDVAAYLNDNLYWSEFLLSMQTIYKETTDDIGGTGDNDYNEGYADGISTGMNTFLDKIEDLLTEANKNDDSAE
jgi:hypothetical protein